MKYKITFLTAIAFSFFTNAFVAAKQYNKIIKEKDRPTSGAAMEDDAGARNKWEVQRLADPATGRIPDNVRGKELAFAATLPNDAQMSPNRILPPLNFVNRGPYNVGGRTRAFGIDVTNENKLLAGSTSGGMWYSTNAGASWTQSSTVSQLKNSSCLIQDKRAGHTETWYYGSGEPYGQSASGTGAFYLGDGIFKSNDGGLSWSALPTTASGNANTFTNSFQLTWNVAMDVSATDSAGEVYAATYGYIWRSIDGGLTWTHVLGSATASYFTDVQVTSTGVVYATLSDDGASKGIWRSTDGITYTNILPATGFPRLYNRVVIGINPNNENEVYFLAETKSTNADSSNVGFGKRTIDFLGTPHFTSLWKYTYVSGTGAGAGGVWQDLSVNLPATGGQFDKIQTQDSYDMVVKVKPGNSNIVFVGGTNIYRSTTAFQDSTHTAYMGGYQEFSHLPVINSYLNHHSDQHRIEFLPSNPDVMYSTNDGGVFKTLDDVDTATVWQNLDNGYLTTMFYTVAIDHATPNNSIICGGAQDNGTWYTNNTNPTSPWLHVHGGDGAYCAIADHQTNYYFSIQNCTRLVKTTLDASGNTTGFRRIDPIGGKGYQWMNPFVLDPNNNNIMYLAGGKYLWRNSDLSAIPLSGGWDSISTNWTRFNDSVPTANVVITALSVCKTPANRVYYGTSNKRIYRVDNANTGSPVPVDITSTQTVAPFPNANVSSIAVDPTDGNKIMVTYSNYGVYSIFYSADGGTTWSKQGGNLCTTSTATINPSVRWASILPVSDGTVYLVATSTGVYATDSLAGTNTQWVLQGTNSIGNAVCDMIETRQSDGLIVIGTHSSGIYSTNITSINSIVSYRQIDVSSDFYLTSYPNPLVQSATIEFVLDKKTMITLQIWDECGRLVETILNESMTEGKHSVQFDRKELKAGIYYYSLTADNRRKTNKMIIIR